MLLYYPLALAATGLDLCTSLLRKDSVGACWVGLNSCRKSNPSGSLLMSGGVNLGGINKGKKNYYHYCFINIINKMFSCYRTRLTYLNGETHFGLFIGWMLFVFAFIEFNLKYNVIEV